VRRREATTALLAITLVPAARAAEPTLEAAIRAWSGAATPRDGRITIEIAELVENGNAVPVTLRAEGAVAELVLFNERNPQRDIVRARFGPLAGPALLSTRIRLATSQRLVALARLQDGSVWQRQVDVLVTLAACVEG
jgi:sulfur-oxidizing protein SoxY